LERKKLELTLNKPSEIELLYDEPVVGQSKYGDYYLYAVRNGDGTTEYSFFAPDEVHERIKELKKGAKVVVTKLAEQKGNKIITKFDVNVIAQAPQNAAQPTPAAQSVTDNYYDTMLQCCKDAIRIQNELGGMMDAKSIAVTLFIARSKNG